jgi:hypothetical protein
MLNDPVEFEGLQSADLDAFSIPWENQDAPRLVTGSARPSTLATCLAVLRLSSDSNCGNARGLATVVAGTEFSTSTHLRGERRR